MSIWSVSGQRVDAPPILQRLIMSKTNSKITFNGAALTLSGLALKEGDKMPPFVLTGAGFEDVRSEAFAGKVLIISAVPSLDTPVCSIQTKRFNTALMNLSPNVAVLGVSMDLPFAQKRWCLAEGSSICPHGGRARWCPRWFRAQHR